MKSRHLARKTDQQVTHVSARGNQWGNNLPGRGLARWDGRRIAALKLPTLIVWGGRDRLYLASDAERFHHDIAGSRSPSFLTSAMRRMKKTPRGPLPL